MNRLKKISFSIRSACEGLSALMCLGLLCLTATPVYATAPTLPDPGVDVADWVPVALTAVGAVIAVAIGARFAILVVKVGMRWASRAFG